MDHEGNTIASSNRNNPDSFVGQNFDFRPYFQQAIQGIPATYLALGTTSGNAERITVTRFMKGNTALASEWL
jgi:C4-dicarboxylate-specific signal transduction histidine kinase